MHTQLVRCLWKSFLSSAFWKTFNPHVKTFVYTKALLLWSLPSFPVRRVVFFLIAHHKGLWCPTPANERKTPSAPRENISQQQVLLHCACSLAFVSRSPSWSRAKFCLVKILQLCLSCPLGDPKIASNGENHLVFSIWGEWNQTPQEKP